MNPDRPEELPEPDLRESRLRVSLIWLVPLITAIAGLVLLARAWMAAGPTITIRFDSAEDLVAGKTEVRYKHVVIGLVRDIELLDDQSGVEVEVDLVRAVEHIAVEDTEFWVARARADLGGISGFKTLVTGAYIGVNIGRSQQAQREFKGREKPPSVTNDRKGRRVLLVASDLGSLNIGSPVYFHRLPVGRIVGFELDADGEGVRVEAFVDTPYDRFVTRDSRFWNASGVDLTLDASGLKLDTQSLVTMLAGGVAFQTPNGASAASMNDPPLDAEFQFPLYANQTAALSPREGPSTTVRMRFNESLRGLVVGAEIDAGGVVVGRVTAIQLDFDPDLKRFVSDVTAELHPQRLGNAAGGGGDEAFVRLVERGLRAQLRSGNLLTGQVYVALDFPRQAKPVKLDPAARPLQIPTASTEIDQIPVRLAEIVRKLDRIPFDQIGARVNDTLGAANGLVRRLDGEVAPAATQALEGLRTTLEGAQQTLISPQAPLQQDLQHTLEEVDRAARSMRELSEYFKRNPDALIRGRTESESEAEKSSE